MKAIESACPWISLWLNWFECLHHYFVAVSVSTSLNRASDKRRIFVYFPTAMPFRLRAQVFKCTRRQGKAINKRRKKIQRRLLMKCFDSRCWNTCWMNMPRFGTSWKIERGIRETAIQIPPKLRPNGWPFAFWRYKSKSAKHEPLSAKHLRFEQTIVLLFTLFRLDNGSN